MLTQKMFLISWKEKKICEFGIPIPNLLKIDWEKLSYDFFCWKYTNLANFRHLFYVNHRVLKMAK